MVLSPSHYRAIDCILAPSKRWQFLRAYKWLPSFCLLAAYQCASDLPIFSHMTGQYLVWRSHRIPNREMIIVITISQGCFMQYTTSGFLRRGSDNCSSPICTLSKCSKHYSQCIARNVPGIFQDLVRGSEDIQENPVISLAFSVNSSQNEHNQNTKSSSL